MKTAAAARLALTLLAIPPAARAVDVGVKVEPGLALALSGPFSVDAAAALKGFVGLGPYVDVAAALVFLGLPTVAGSLSPESGRAWAGGGGVVLRLPRESEAMRLKRPHDQEAVFGASPWVDGDALFVRTGLFAHFGFQVGAGVSFPLGEARSLWLGPFVRYLQIVANDAGGPGAGGVRTLIVGLSLEAGTNLSRTQAAP